MRYKVKEEGLSFYNLRHSCGIYWRKCCHDQERLLCHTSEAMSRVYAAIEPDVAGDEFERAWNRQNGCQSSISG